MDQVSSNNGYNYTKTYCLKPPWTLFFAASASIEFKQVLRNNLDKGWFQLATAMGLRRSYMTVWQIDTFLANYKFPAFNSNRETAHFLVETLASASLPNVAARVKEELEITLHLEGVSVCACISVTSCGATCDCMPFLLYLLDIGSTALKVKFRST